MDKNEIKEIVFRIVKNHFYNEKEYDDLIKNSNNIEDLKLYKGVFIDSLDLIEFTIELENEFEHKFVFDYENIKEDMTIKKVVDYIDNKLNNENSL